MARRIVAGGHADEWSLQGFGMFRLYLSKEVRLHVWDPQFAVPNVSTIHDHPWDFESLVLQGAITNRVFYQADMPDGQSATHHEQKIVCGPGGHPVGDKRDVRLRVAREHTYGPGESYLQDAMDLHETSAERGTITIVKRRFREDTEHARVYFPLGTEWVSAEPRAATTEELGLMRARVLAR